MNINEFIEYKKMQHINYTNEYCECIEPDWDGDQWVSIGNSPQNTSDYKLCNHCDLPIRGSQTTHEEDN